MATSDPLLRAFSETVGRLVPLDGTVGIALLLAVVTEIFSCFGLASLRVLKDQKAAVPSGMIPDKCKREEEDYNKVFGTISRSVAAAPHNGAVPAKRPVPESSLKPIADGIAAASEPHYGDVAGPPSNVISLWQGSTTAKSDREARDNNTTALQQTVSPVTSNVSAFVHARLSPAAGASVSASEIRAAYEQWCASQGQEPRSQQKLGVDLAGLGLSKWKSCGRIRYRDVQLAA